ncbi:MAG: SMP-30/gluconolactonase/LRE family protein [Reichenbachiella sp.]|uniref:SMP-30/gluconolactonase/LRE family protein n=1 Tax=Reichenbachiella sp. TaxID=2184521 RepID=UPI003263C386
MKLFNMIAFLVAVCQVTSCQQKAETTSQDIDGIDHWEASLYVEMQNKLGEGAIYNYVTREFWHIDIEGKSFYTTRVDDKKQRQFEVGQRIGTIVPSDSNRAVVALQDGIYSYSLLSNEMNLICSPEDTIPNIRYNDGKCDSQGRLWVGSMGLNQKKYRASLYSIAYGEPRQRLDSITISNGIVWSGDNQTMYYTDTPDGNVKAFDFDEKTGDISNKRIVIEIGELGFPDGMAIDAEGMLWIALWNGNMVGRWDPSTGQLIGKVSVPAHNITSCAFVGDSLDSLIITTARVDMSDDELKANPLSGSLFVVVPGVRGVKSHFYQMAPENQP